MSSWTGVYVACAGSNDILLFELDKKKGDLRKISETKVPGGSVGCPYSMPLALSPDHRFIYAGVRVAPFPLSTFTVDPKSGELTLQDSGATLPGQMAYLTVDKAGRNILGASYLDKLLMSLPIDADGVARQQAAQIETGLGGPHSIILDRSGLHAYTGLTDGDKVGHWQYLPDSGRLTSPVWSDVPKRAGARHVRFGSAENTLYSLNERNASITVFRRDASNGMLEQFQQIETQEKPGPAMAADIQVTPNGRWLYATERNSNTITAFLIDPASGGLTFLERYPSEDWTRSFAIDARGRFLLALGQKSDQMTVFTIDQDDGRLKPQSRIPLNSNPTWIEVVDF